MVVHVLASACLVLAVSGVAYTVLAGGLTRRFFDDRGSRSAAPASNPIVTLLKPLHGAEPGLQARLNGFARQDHPAAQIVFGSDDVGDAALDIARAAMASCPPQNLHFVANAALQGQNRKVSNIINMMDDAAPTTDPCAVYILSDSDIGVPSNYVTRISAAVSAPGVGVVTCPYYGEPTAGFWSEIAAMGISYHFLSNMITGVALGLAKPCMGSTIGLTQSTLNRIGGFRAFRDSLADDYAIGAAVRGLGLRSAVAPLLVSHGCAEASLKDLVAHELRWLRTVRTIDPKGHVGSLVTHPFALALMATLLSGASPLSLSLLAAAMLARLWLFWSVNQVVGRTRCRWWLLPVRDVLSFGLFACSFVATSVEWSGVRFDVTPNGNLTPSRHPILRPSVAKERLVAERGAEQIC